MKETNKGWSQEAYIKAYRFAAERHKGQLVPGTEWSYLAHLSMVGMEIMAALNHETDIRLFQGDMNPRKMGRLGTTFTYGYSRRYKEHRMI